MKKIFAVLVAALLSFSGIAYAGTIDDSGFEFRAAFGPVVNNSYADTRGEGGMVGFQVPLKSLSPNLKLAVDFINEGNPKDSVKRDGCAVRLMYQLPVTLFDGRLTFSLGAGPYAYFSTEKPLGTDGSQYIDRHGIGGVATPLELGYAVTKHVTTSLAFHRVFGHKDMNGNGTDKDMFFLGLGYKFY